MCHDAGGAVWEKPFPGESGWLQCSQAIRLSGCDGMAAGVQRRGHAESRPRGLTEVAFVSGLPRPRGSPGWGCNLLEDSCCWALEADDGGQCKPSKRIKTKQGTFSICITHKIWLYRCFSICKRLWLLGLSLTSVETGELALPGSAVQLSEGPCKGDLGLQWSPVGEGDCPSVWIFCAVLGWM